MHTKTIKSNLITCTDINTNTTMGIELWVTLGEIRSLESPDSVSITESYEICLYTGDGQLPTLFSQFAFLQGIECGRLFFPNPIPDKLELTDKIYLRLPNQLVLNFNSEQYQKEYERLYHDLIALKKTPPSNWRHFPQMNKIADACSPRDDKKND